MEPLELVRGKIPGFPSYVQDTDRRRSDELVRSYLGEALAAAQERFAGDPALVEALEKLVIRTAFTNQAVFRIFEESVRDEAGFDDVLREDVHVIELADRVSAATDPAAAAGMLDDVTKALNRRDHAMASAPSAPPPSRV